MCYADPCSSTCDVTLQLQPPILPVNHCPWLVVGRIIVACMQSTIVEEGAGEKKEGAMRKGTAETACFTYVISNKQGWLEPHVHGSSAAR
jgi:hypothetical protein